MNKRKRKSPLHGNDGNDDDVISTLPDYILIKILSSERLNIKEAGRASVLSRRWRDLWRFRCTSLEFDYRDAEIDPDKTLAPLSRMLKGANQFINWIDQALKSHQDACPSTSVDKLSVCFGFRNRNSFSEENTGSNSLRIETWIRFVMQRRVCVFELNSMGGIPFPNLNDFRMEETRRDPLLFSSLKTLVLLDVNVEDEIIL